MIKFENTEVTGWEAAIRGMRNPMNSWEKSDSKFYNVDNLAVEDRYKISEFEIGPNDLDLMKRLHKAGTDHRKFMRMIIVYVDITAPLYFFKEFDTYKVGTVANSCSTMHKISAKKFTLEDFSYEHLTSRAKDKLEDLINELNYYRNLYLNGGNDYWTDSDDKDYEPKDKKIWWQMIQLLPSSYNQRRTVMLNYEVLANIYKSRKNHKLDEWAEHKEGIPNIDSSSQAKYSKPYKEYFGFCDWIKTLPYSELITGEIE